MGKRGSTMRPTNSTYTQEERARRLREVVERDKYDRDPYPDECRGPGGYPFYESNEERNDRLFELLDAGISIYD